MKKVLMVLVGLSASIGSTPQAKLNFIPPNFHEVSSDLYRGGRITSEGMAAYLHEIVGVKTVIDLQGGDYIDESALKELGPDLYHKIAKVSAPGESPEDIAAEVRKWVDVGLSPQNDFNFPIDAVAPIDNKEKAEISRVLQILMDPSTPRPIYIHCTHGIDRTGMVIALYRVLHDGWTPKKAHDEMVCIGHDADPKGPNHFMDYYFYQAVSPKSLFDGEYTGTNSDVSIMGTFADGQVVTVPENGGRPVQIYMGGLVSSPAMVAGLIKTRGVKTVINLEGAEFNNPARIKIYSAETWHQYEDIVDPGSDTAAIAAEEKELQAAANGSALNYQNIPLSVSGGLPKAQIDQILKVLSDPATPRPIYIHAAKSMLLPSFIISLYRFKYDQWTANAAHAELMAAGFDPHILDNYEDYFIQEAGKAYQPAPDPWAQKIYCNSLKNE